MIELLFIYIILLSKDFGFASLLTDDSQDLNAAVSETFCGTLPYYSPQLVSKKPYNPFKSDVWAMAVVLYAMISNRYPFHFKDVKQMYKEQTNYPAYIRSRFSNIVSQPAQDLVERMVNPDEHQRPTMDDVLKDEWLNNTPSTYSNVE